MNKFILAAVLAMSASFASATTMTYQTAPADTVVKLTADDRANAGALTLTLEAISGEADLFGLGFHTDLELEQSDIALLGATNRAGDDTSGSVALSLRSDATETRGAGRFATLGADADANGTTHNCGKGCNFGGASNGAEKEYDYILRIGENGAEGDDFVSSVSFTIAGADLSDFTYFGFRGHSFTDKARGMKSTLTHAETIPSVPLPAGGALLLTGLLGMAAFRKRARA